MTTHARHGMSRAEVIVLVVIGILLAALLLPAIQRMREASLENVCADRLHYLGLASHRYHDDYGKLPADYYSAVKDHGNNTHYALERGPHIGCLAVLLPYCENDAVFNQLSNSAVTWPALSQELAGIRPLKIDLRSESMPWWKEPGNLLAKSGQMRIKAFACPLDEINDESITTGIVSLQIANGSFAYISVPEAHLLGRTNYVGVAGTSGDYDDRWGKNYLWSEFLGCLYNRSRLTLGQLINQDGTSNMLLFGETLGSTGVGPRTTTFTWFGAGTMGTAYGLGRGNEPGLDNAIPPPLGSMPAPGTIGASWFRFSSRHRRGVQFCFADGSVRALQFGNTASPDLSNNGINESDWSILQKLAGRRDGLLEETFAIPD